MDTTAEQETIIEALIAEGYAQALSFVEPR